MKISEKIKNLLKRVNDLECSDLDWITLTISPLADNYGFQVWFDKWTSDGAYISAKRVGQFNFGKRGDVFAEDTSLVAALNDLEQHLDNYEEEKQLNLYPETILHNGRTYRLEK